MVFLNEKFAGLPGRRGASVDRLQRGTRQIRTWPFDTPILERFPAIIVSVVAITIANVIKLIL